MSDFKVFENSDFLKEIHKKAYQRQEPAPEWDGTVPRRAEPPASRDQLERLTQPRS